MQTVRVSANRSEFWHYKGEPPMHIITESEQISTPDVFKNICKTARFQWPGSLPAVCACGEYDLIWE